MDAKESISQYWDWRSRSYTNGSHGFEEEEKAVWKMELEPFLQGEIQESPGCGDRSRIYGLDTGGDGA